MRDSILRDLVFVGVALLALVVGAGTAAWAQAPLNPAQDEAIVRIPSDWREMHPFSMRFADTRGAEHVIDLAAVRFVTDRLVTLVGEREFQEPDLASFAPSLVRRAFGRRARDQGIVRRRVERRERDLFIVQATDPEAQIALRTWLTGTGIPILGYIPQDAYLVRLDRQTRAALGAQETVFWIGLFQPAYRVAPKLDVIHEADPTHRLKLRLRLDPEIYPSREAVLSMVGAVPEATVVDVARTSHDWIVRVDGPVALARAFAGQRGCLWVERFVDIQLSNNVARTSADVPTGRGTTTPGPILDVEDVWARGIRGEGQIAAASDTGLSTGDLTTPDSLHWDFGQVGSATNPMRVLKGYAVGRPTTWDDDQSIGGGHGTHTSGSIVGNGIESGSDPSNNDFPGWSYTGVAPKAQFVFQSLMDSSGALTGPSDLNNLFLPPYNDGARVHSNSWGAPGAGEYDALSQTLDEFVWNHQDMVITFAAGNSGADGHIFFFDCLEIGTPIDGVVDSYSINSPGTAKNAITVGASESRRPDFVYQTFLGETCSPSGSFDQRAWGWASSWCFTVDPIYSDKFADDASGLAAFSSRGPTQDLRVKPDLVAPGAVVTSTRTNLNQDFEQWGECEIPTGYRPHYLNQGGTSMANPLTAGAATLVRQYYADGWHANDSDVTNSTPVPAQGFNPSAALVKATLINGAWDMTPGQYGTSAPQPEIAPDWDRAAGRDLPNNAEGYGRVDLEASLFPHAGWGRSTARRMDVRDVTSGIATGARSSDSYGVGSGSGPLIATLVWTDPYATAGAGSKLVNNLDLEVTSPSGRRYTTNRGDGFVTAPTPFVRDAINNVEQVKVTVPETGLWTIDVVGTTVPGNGVSGTTTQPFALVVSAVTCAVPDAPTGAAAAANGNNRIDVTWDATGASEYRVYRGTSPGEVTSLVGTVAGTSFVDTTVLGGWTYYYVVKSTSSPTCESATSVEVSATATGVCTLGPDFAGLASVTSSGTAVCGLDLSWAAGSALCGGPVSYSVYRSAVSGFAPAVENRIAAGLADTSFVDSSALAPGTTYYYVVRATDEGNGVQETNTVEHGAVPKGTASNLFGPEDFEGFADGSSAGWTQGLAWVGVRTCTAHSGAKIFRFGAAACSAPYPTSTLSSARPPGIVVPAGASNVRLSFWHRWNFESGYDGGYLRISLNGTSYTDVPAAALLSNPYNGIVFDLFVEAWTDIQSAFVNTLVDLDAACDAIPGNSGGCAGKTVYVAFNAYTDVLDLGGPYTGWFIDDVHVTAEVPDSCSAAPEPVPFLSARSTSGTNLLEWQNPSGGTYGAAVVRFRTDGTFPTSVADGTGVTCPGQNIGLGAYNSCTHSVANGTPCHYSLFVDNGAGVYSSRRTVSATPFDTSGPRKWAYSTGAASLAPAGILPGAIGTGAVFALSNDLALHAMDPTDGGGSWPRSGSFAWTPVAMNAPAQHRPPVVPTPAGPRIFLASQDGYAYAVDGATGALAWTSVKLGDVLQANPAALLSHIELTAPDLLFVGTRNAASANTLFGLDPSTGAVVTQFDNGGGATAIGIITGIGVDYATNSVYFSSRASGTGSSDTLWCLDATGGTLSKLWSLPVGDIDGSPVLYQGRLYVGTNTGLVRAIDATTHAVVWTYTPAPADGPVKGFIYPGFGSSPPRLYYATSSRVSAIDDNGNSAGLGWSVATVSNPSTPLYVIGTTHLLVGSGNGTLYQLDVASGAITGSVNLGTSGLGSPARDVINNRIHVGSTAGVVHTVTLPLP